MGIHTRIERDMESNGHVAPHANNLMICILPPIVLFVVACIDLAKKLNLGSNQIGDIGAEKLAEALPHLTSLTVARLGSPSLLCVGQNCAPMCYARMPPVVW